MNSTPDNPSPEFLKKILSDRRVMVAITRKSMLYFFHVYFRKYIKYFPAPFHNEMFKIAQDDSIKRACIVAFRGSAKSTILNTAYVLWAVMGILQKKFVIIASQTQQQARGHLRDIRKEIEENTLLRYYLGPFKETEDMWNTATLIIPRYDNARISAISVEEGIRGIKEGPSRPNLIIADDIEDLNSVRTKEGRDKTFEWLTSELLPLGTPDTKLIILGNFLDTDSATLRIRKLITSGEMKGISLHIPILDEDNNIAWPAMFPSLETIEEFKRSIGNEIAWQREYLLHIIADIDQTVNPEWLHYYDELPRNKDIRYIATGVDLAISQSETADYTAAVSAIVSGYGKDLKIYILPNPLNERLTFPEAVERIKIHSKTVGGGHYTHLYVENVGYQQAFVEQLNREGCKAEGVKIYGQDKRARLALTTAMIQNGTVLFPRKGAEKLIEQLVGFGVEKHDDLADAFSLLTLHLISQNHFRPRIRWI